jgi:iron complex outermembrane receptor protein
MRKEGRVARMALAALLASTSLGAPAFAQVNSAPAAEQAPSPTEQAAEKNCPPGAPQPCPAENPTVPTAPVKEGDIVITAERYGGSVRTTPIAVTALGEKALTERQVLNVRDLVTQVPGITLAPATAASSQMKVVVRGAGTETGGIRANGTVGVYIDNVIQPRPMGQFFDFFDISRVEFLRGPQGTLYGRNTSGGAIKLLTKQPAYQWTGAAQLGVGDWEALEAKGYISGPIIPDKLAFSISGVHREREGFLKGLLVGRQVGNLDRSAERGKLLFEPTEKLRFVASVYAMQDYSDAIIPIPLTVLPGVNDPYAVPDRDLTIIETFPNLKQSIKQWGASLNATYDIGHNLQLGSITGYGKLKQFNLGNDTFLTPAIVAARGGLINANNTKVHLDDHWWTQEVNLIYTGERLKAVAGLYYFYEDGTQQGAAGTAQTDDARNTVKAPAVFGQATYEIVDGLSAVAGARYTRETTDFFALTIGSAAGNQVGHDTFSSFTPKLGLNWEINDDVFTYVSWTKGTRSGGFNSRDPATGQLKPTPFGAEWVDSYELGTKLALPAGFRLNATAFVADYSDLQLSTFIPGNAIIVTLNAGAARVWGLELEPNWQVSDSFDVYSNIAFNRGKYTKDFTCANQFGVFVDCTENRIKGLPKFKAGTGFRFSPRITGMPGRLTFNGSWDHTTKIYNNISNEPELVQTPKLDLFNGSIAWRSEDSRWSASVEGRNLTNKHYVLAGLLRSDPRNPTVVGYVAEPRQILARVGYEF